MRWHVVGAHGSNRSGGGVWGRQAYLCAALRRTGSRTARRGSRGVQHPLVGDVGAKPLDF